MLDTETISSFTTGVYLDWKVSGNLVITITRTAGANAVLNGLFLDPIVATHARPRVPRAGRDDAGELDRHLRRPGLRHRLRPVQPPGQRHGHAQRAVDLHLDHDLHRPPRLQVPGSSNRVAAVWYSATSFTVDVNLADGQTHDLELYFDDWDNKGRAEQVQISDAGTGTVLDTETISSFTIGRVPGLEGLGQPGDHDHQDGRGQCRPQWPVPRLSTSPTAVPLGETPQPGARQSVNVYGLFSKAPRDLRACDDVIII